MMDSISDPLIESVVVMSAAQIGKTEIINNVIVFTSSGSIPIPGRTADDRDGRDVEQGPPRSDAARYPGTPGLGKGSRSRDSGNTLRQKSFPGDRSPSPGRTRRHPGIPACASGTLDEVDRFPPSAVRRRPGKTRSKRTTTSGIGNHHYLNSHRQGASRVEAEWEESDQRRFHVLARTARGIRCCGGGRSSS